MAKKESTFINMTLTLLGITLIASAGLGVVYGLTKSPIAAVKLANKNISIQEVLPAFDNQPYAEMYKIPVDGDTLYCYPGKMKGELVGTAVETFSERGFSGKIKVIVGFLPDGTINSCKITEHKETPGLGDKMDKSKSDFAIQFDKKDLKKFRSKVKKDGGDVDAITAATISSRAFCDAIQRAFNAYTNSTTDANSGATQSSNK
jgi:Na+-translocating ferredoxin:NAD+ oxidoreductase subunit G